jgi:hypothetical protein
MSQVMRLAVVNVSTLVAAPDVERVVAACRSQIETHLQPVWSVGAQIEIWPDLACIPGDAFRVLVADDEQQVGALGHHDAAEAMIGVQDANLMGVPWSCVLSHEICETLVNPRLDRWSDPDASGASWAYEVCDPVENQRYEVSGVAVSDFVFPAFFDPAAHGKLLNWRRTLTAPFTVEPPNGHAVTRSADGAAQPFPGMPMLAWPRSPRSRRQRLLAAKR